MSVKLIRTGRRRTMTISGTLSSQAPFFRSRVASTPSPGQAVKGGYSNVECDSLGGTTTGFPGVGISFQGVNTSTEPPTVTVALTGVSGRTLVVPISPDPAPAATGSATTYGAVYILTATVNYAMTIYLVEIEKIDTTYGSRQFFEYLADDLTSTFSATLTCNGQSTTYTRTAIGNDPVGTSPTNWNVSQSSYYALAQVASQRLGDSSGYSDTYTLTASATASNVATGCDFTPSTTATATSTGCSASSNTATATAPSDTSKSARASFDQRIHAPKTTFRVKSRRFSLNGTPITPPYPTTGRAFWAYRTSTSNTATFLKVFDTAQPLDAPVVFGFGYTLATAWYTDRFSTVGGAPSFGGTGSVQQQVFFPFANNTPPTGTAYGNGTPGACAVLDSGFTTDHAAGDAFQPTGTPTAWRLVTNSLATCGIAISQAANVVVADYPFLAGGRFSGAWSATNAGSVTEVSGSRLRIEATATNPTVATLTFPSALSVGYRWMKARIRGVGSDPIPITITVEDGTGTVTTLISQTATLATGANDIWLDLLKTTRNILATANSSTTQATIATYRRVTIAVPVGKAVEVEYLRWERRDFSSASILLAYGSSADTDQNRFLPGLSCFTDGMPSKGVDRTVIQTNPLLTSFPSKAAQTGWTGNYFGVVAQSNTAQSDLLESQELNALEPRLDVGVSSAVQFRGGRSCHGVIAYYGCGDVLGGGGYSDTTEVRYDTYVGSEMLATIINAKTPTVRTKKTSDGTLFSSRDFAATGGYYGVLTPDILQTTGTTTSASKRPSYIVRGNIGTISGNTLLWNSSATQTYRAWLGLSIAGAGRRVASMVHPYLGYFARVMVNTEGTAVSFQRTSSKYTTSASLLPAVTIATMSGTDEAAYPAISVEFTPKELIRVRWQQGSAGSYSVYESQSTDDGATWSTPTMAIANARQPILGTATDGSGLILETGFIADTTDETVGVIKGTWLIRPVTNPTGTPFPAVFTFQKVVSSVKSDLRITDGGFDLVQLREGQSRWCLSCIIEGEAGFSDWVSADEGLFTFTRVA